MNFKKIADAFGLKFIQIKKTSEIKKKLMNIFSNNKPCIIEVFTDPNQKIYGNEFLIKLIISMKNQKKIRLDFKTN